MNQEETCQLCNGSKLTLRYHGPIRAGTVGKTTKDNFKVLECDNCKVAYLAPFPSIDYASEEYRELYNDSSLIEGYFALHDKNQINHLSVMSDISFRNKVVGDFGAGGGSFLDYVSGIAKHTIAIEPFTGYHQSLREHGHQVYQFGSDLLTDRTRPLIDIAVSFHVIEHVSNPVTYLKEIHTALAKDGVLYLVTPNLDDILIGLEKETYEPFFYRTAHPWYFNAHSLTWVAKQAGFSKIKVFFQHNYDLSNAFCWLHDKKPTGLGRLKCFDEQINFAWRSFLETKGISDTVWLKLES